MTEEPKKIIRNGEIHEYRESFYEEDEEDPYFYDITFKLGSDQKHAHGIIITAFGVSIDWYGGSSTHTNITPNSIFPNRKKLSEAELIHIMDLVSKSGFEGMKYSRKEMKALKEFYEKELEQGNEN